MFDPTYTGYVLSVLSEIVGLATLYFLSRRNRDEHMVTNMIAWLIILIGFFMAGLGLGTRYKVNHSFSLLDMGVFGILEPLFFWGTWVVGNWLDVARGTWSPPYTGPD